MNKNVIAIIGGVAPVPKSVVAQLFANGLDAAFSAPINILSAKRGLGVQAPRAPQKLQIAEKSAENGTGAGYPLPTHREPDFLDGKFPWDGKS